MAILVTGGAGYIGSHTCVELLNQDYEVIIVDNLCNSNNEVLYRIEEITGKRVTIYYIDLFCEKELEQVFLENNIEAVVHVAGFKAVGESVKAPLKYYSNNLVSTLNLCSIMEKHGINKLIFSSSATVYGISNVLPINENNYIMASNPYGRTKLMIEKILKDLFTSNT